MKNPFGFFGMSDNYGNRKIARYERSKVIVDTVSVNDSEQPFETAVCHLAYNPAEWIIVEMYATVEEARAGHDRWVKTMTAKTLPTYLRDVSTAKIKRLGEAIGAFGKFEKHERIDTPLEV